MKIREGRNEKDELIYFEVSSSFLSRRRAKKVISRIPCVKRVDFHGRSDIFCTFELGGRAFEVLEPFGDNSRYHIGEKEVMYSNEIEIIKNHFASYKPWPLSLFSS